MDELPRGTLLTRVDPKGRLKVPRAFIEVIDLQKSWFVVEGKEREVFGIQPMQAAGCEEAWFDDQGRMLIPYWISERFKDMEVYVWRDNASFQVGLREYMERSLRSRGESARPESETP